MLTSNKPYGLGVSYKKIKIEPAITTELAYIKLAKLGKKLKAKDQIDFYICLGFLRGTIAKGNE